MTTHNVLIFTTAPPIFDITGVSVCVMAALYFFALTKGPLASNNPQLDLYARVIASITGLTPCVYTVYFLGRGMGGFNNLLKFLFDLADDRHSWTVWVTIGVWSALVIACCASLKYAYGRQIVPAGTIPVILPNVLAGAIGVVALYYQLFFTVSRTDPYLWTAAMCGNFILTCWYYALITNAVASIIAPRLPIFQGKPSATTPKDDAALRNAPMMAASFKRPWWRKVL